MMKKNGIAQFAVAAMIAAALAGCSRNYRAEPPDLRNPVVGGVAGAAAGGAIGGIATGSTRGALVGAGIGAVAGALASHLADDRDRGVEVIERGDTVVVNLPSVTFDTDRTDILPGFYAPLNDVAQVLREHPEVTAVVVGHTDSQGSDDYNLDLSRRRAATVAFYLEDQGVAHNALTAEGRGEFEPIASNATVDGRARNRRVEIRIRERRA